MASFEVRPKKDVHSAVVHWYEDAGCFAYVAETETGIVGGGAENRELTSVGKLVEASAALIDWNDDVETLRALALLERSQYDKDTRRILDRVFV